MTLFRRLESGDGNSRKSDSGGLQTGNCNTRGSYLLESLAHNSPRLSRHKFKASPCLKETQGATHRLPGRSYNTEDQQPTVQSEEQAPAALCQRSGEQTAVSGQKPPVPQRRLWGVYRHPRVSPASTPRPGATRTPFRLEPDNPTDTGSALAALPW